MVSRGRRQSDQHSVLLKVPARVSPHRAETDALERQFELLRELSVAPGLVESELFGHVNDIRREAPARPAKPESLDDLQRLHILDVLKSTGGIPAASREAS